MPVRAIVATTLLLCLLAPAHGAIWERHAPADGNRALALARADEHLEMARLSWRAWVASQGMDARARRDAKESARRALKEYERAATMGPPDADIHYRAFLALYYYELIEDHPEYHEKLVHHVDALRAADPLDPRDEEVTIPVCHSLAKLAAGGRGDAEALYERVTREYARWFSWIDETAPGASRALGTNYTNVAEVYMALGRLDEAIAYYQKAAEHNLGDRPELVWFGLAVAYDRNGQWAYAVEAMRRATEYTGALATIEGADGDTGVYFIPKGDKWYYLALAHHVEGRRREAVEAYKLFLRIAKGARPEYRKRAQEHLRDLEGHGP